jgi:putative membrane protein insertion efficiency factor
VISGVVRTLMGAVGWLVLKLLRAYKLLVSPLLGQRCRFYPSCSEYAAGCIEKHGLGRGLILAVKRIIRCNPFNPGGVDPVP